MEFSDVPADAWFHNYVTRVYAGGLVKGYKDGTFRPNAPITRQELAALIVRAKALEAPPTGRLHFTDAHQISPWAKDYISAAANQGWLQGDTVGTLRPRQHITRAEAVALFTRALERSDTNSESLRDVRSDLRIFNDVSDPRLWYFYYVVEASHNHWFILTNGVSRWTSIN